MAVKKPITGKLTDAEHAKFRRQEREARKVQPLGTQSGTSLSGGTSPEVGAQGAVQQAQEAEKAHKGKVEDETTK